MRMKQTLWAAFMLMALTAYKNNEKVTAEVINLLCAGTPTNVAKD